MLPLRSYTPKRFFRVLLGAFILFRRKTNRSARKKMPLSRLQVQHTDDGSDCRRLMARLTFFFRGHILSAKLSFLVMLDAPSALLETFYTDVLT